MGWKTLVRKELSIEANVKMDAGRYAEQDEWNHPDTSRERRIQSRHRTVLKHEVKK
jgi:hypothetical protein